MHGSPRLTVHQATARLQRLFLETVQRCQEKLVALDLAELQAACLGALAQLGGGPAVLLLPAGGEGEYRLELSSGVLPWPPERFAISIPRADRDACVVKPETLAGHGEFARLAGAIGVPELIVEPLVLHDALDGVILQVPSPSLQDSDRESLRALGEHIRALLQTAAVFNILMSQAMLDDLTGLFNLRYFRLRLPAEISRASRHGHPLSLLFCDLDDFKRFNEKNGHPTGNLLLRELSELLRTGGRRSDVVISFRNSDIPVRFGGEEFAVLLPETPKWGALTKADRLRRAIQATPFVGRESQPGGQVTISIGVASFPEDAADATALLEAADAALRKAKAAGKNRVEPSVGSATDR